MRFKFFSLLLSLSCSTLFSNFQQPFGLGMEITITDNTVKLTVMCKAAYHYARNRSIALSFLLQNTNFNRTLDNITVGVTHERTTPYDQHHDLQRQFAVSYNNIAGLTLQYLPSYKDRGPWPSWFSWADLITDKKFPKKASSLQGQRRSSSLKFKDFKKHILCGLTMQYHPKKGINVFATDITGEKSDNINNSNAHTVKTLKNFGTDPFKDSSMIVAEFINNALIKGIKDGYQEVQEEERMKKRTTPKIIRHDTQRLIDFHNRSK